MQSEKKKNYEKPKLTKIRLDAKCAVLGFCKTSGKVGPGVGSLWTWLVMVAPAGIQASTCDATNDPKIKCQTGQTVCGNYLQTLMRWPNGQKHQH